jgi:hypothetical protein
MRVVLALAALASVGATYAVTKATMTTSSACVHRRGGGLYVAKHCARRDGRVSFVGSVLTATGDTGPKLEPGTYDVTVTAHITNDETHNVMGACQATLSISPTAPFKFLGGVFLLGAAPSGVVTAPGDWIGAFSFTGVVTVAAAMQPHFGCIAADSDQVSINGIQWWVTSA